MIGVLQRIKDFALSVWNAIAGAAADAGQAQGAAASAGAGGFARDGPIVGPGIATSDSVPIRASAGEFMVRAAAVRKYGLGVFHALNAMRLPKDLFRGFSEGGVVEQLQLLAPPVLTLRFADGGLIPAPAGPINLQIGSEPFAGMMADRGCRLEIDAGCSHAPDPERRTETQPLRQRAMTRYERQTARALRHRHPGLLGTWPDPNP